MKTNEDPERRIFPVRSAGRATRQREDRLLQSRAQLVTWVVLSIIALTAVAFISCDRRWTLPLSVTCVLGPVIYPNRLQLELIKEQEREVCVEMRSFQGFNQSGKEFTAPKYATAEALAPEDKPPFEANRDPVFVAYVSHEDITKVHRGDLMTISGLGKGDTHLVIVDMLGCEAKPQNLVLAKSIAAESNVRYLSLRNGVPATIWIGRQSVRELLLGRIRALISPSDVQVPRNVD